MEAKIKNIKIVEALMSFGIIRIKNINEKRLKNIIPPEFIINLKSLIDNQLNSKCLEYIDDYQFEISPQTKKRFESFYSAQLFNKMYYLFNDPLIFANHDLDLNL
ncbi:hypothetical protein BpHYR1_041413 [Brachionus plicatilis]|uniref:Uncharacterized protein n=1 Tax=Brachionus plicatilis TaxID=10195 RepID=A0A3M7SM52_BRAPC|nr:hypothetical protein BpHYR1_041413 [Brachionus plicatilis]